MGYLRENLLEGLRASPRHTPLRAWALVPVFAAIALATGFSSGLLRFEPVPTGLMPLLLVTLFIFPSLLEEAFFRGVLIPRDTIDRGPGRSALALAGSTVLFTLWHPLNALTINPLAMPVFLDPVFLSIVAALGVTCGYSYIVSRCLWVPVAIHWITVVIWVMFLGGRNCILEL